MSGLLREGDKKRHVRQQKARKMLGKLSRNVQNTRKGINLYSRKYIMESISRRIFKKKFSGTYFS